MLRETLVKFSCPSKDCPSWITAEEAAERVGETGTEDPASRNDKRKRDGGSKMEAERWRQRDGGREMEATGWRQRDGGREMDAAGSTSVKQLNNKACTKSAGNH